MSAVLGVTIKTALVVLGALAASAALQRHAASLRHSVLATALVACLALPVFELVLPRWSLFLSLPTAWSSASVVSQRWVSEPAAASPDPGSTSSRMRSGSGVDWPMTLPYLVLVVWLGGALIGLGVSAAGVLRLRRIAARAEAVNTGAWRAIADDLSRTYGLPAAVRLLRCRHEDLVATWGTRRPAIFLPRSALTWSEERIDVVLRHELAHVHRLDWLTTMIASLVRAVYWFNPLLWIAHRRLRDEAERACDDLVLRSGIAGADYAAHLVDVARDMLSGRQAWSPAIAIAQHSRLEGRVRAMLDPRLNRQPLTVFARLAVILVLFSTVSVLGAVSVSGRTTPPPPVPAVHVGSPAIIQSSPSLNVERPVSNPPTTPVPPAATQAGGGAIEGVLYDPFGGFLPGASVTMTAVRSGATQTTVTDRSGGFAFRELAADAYEMITALPGFTTVRNVVRAEPGVTVRRHIALPIGTISETIAVTCAPSADPSTRPGAPSAAAAPGVMPPSARVQRGVEPTLPATFTGGIGGQIRAPRKLTHVFPACPTGVALQPTIVRLAGRIGIDGLISDLHETGDQTDPAYLASAMDAVRQWTFSPTLLNGAPIEVNITIRVDYGR